MTPADLDRIGSESPDHLMREPPAAWDRLLALARRGLRAERETCGTCESHDEDKHGHWCRRVCRIEQNMQTHNVEPHHFCAWWRAREEEK